MTNRTPVAPRTTPPARAQRPILRELALGAALLIGTYAVIFALRWLIQDHVPNREDVNGAVLFIPVFLALRALQLIRERSRASLQPPTAE
jgi:hypothetical protein